MLGCRCMKRERDRERLEKRENNPEKNVPRERVVNILWNLVSHNQHTEKINYDIISQQQLCC